MSAFRAAVIAAACFAVLAEPALAQKTAGATAMYVRHAERYFGSFAGSSANLGSLVRGLRTASQVTLRGSGETARFTPPTKPMSFGNIHRTLELAQRELGAAGIKDPTPGEIKAVLVGGGVRGPNGTASFAGVLQLRSQGMNWAEIAREVRVHPEAGRFTTIPFHPPRGAEGIGAPPPRPANGVVAAAGDSPVRPE